MSPVPIIERQRALTIIGEIRTGDEMRENPRTGKPLVGKKLETFRLTSQHRELIQAAAEKWGGEVKPWESPRGPAWQVVTQKSSIPCAILLGYSLDLIYEKWEGATKCVHRCDGVRDEVTGLACPCNASGVDECDIITRLTVILPGLGTTLGWRLRSGGENAARELGGAMELAEGIAAGRSFVPAILRLSQRRSVSDGEVYRYVVPTLDLRLRSALDALEAAPEQPALEAGQPNGPTDRTSVQDGLREMERRAGDQPVRTARSAEPIGGAAAPPPPVAREIVTGDESPSVGAAAPLPEPSAPPSAAATAVAEPPAERLISADQVTRLWTIARGRGLDDDAVHEITMRVAGVDSVKAVTRDLYDEVIQTIEETDVTPGQVELREPPPAEQATLDAPPPDERLTLTERLLELATTLGVRDSVYESVVSNRSANETEPERHLAWLREQIAGAEAAVQRGTAA